MPTWGPVFNLNASSYRGSQVSSSYRRSFGGMSGCINIFFKKVGICVFSEEEAADRVMK